MSADDIKPILTDQDIDDIILVGGHRNAVGGIYATSAYAFAKEVAVAAIRADRASHAPSLQGDAPALPPIDADMVEILGRPNFACRDIADVLRLAGRDIPEQSEHEQAHTLHYLLGFKLRHGADWWAHARDDLQNVLDTARSTPAKVGA